MGNTKGSDFTDYPLTACSYSPRPYKVWLHYLLFSVFFCSIFITMPVRVLQLYFIQSQYSRLS
jgi:hypothetical protein